MAEYGRVLSMRDFARWLTEAEPGHDLGMRLALALKIFDIAGSSSGQFPHPVAQGSGHSTALDYEELKAAYEALSARYVALEEECERLRKQVGDKQSEIDLLRPDAESYRKNKAREQEIGRTYGPTAWSRGAKRASDPPGKKSK
jgi:hypothetical protein